MANPSLDSLMDRVIRAQQALTEAQDRLSDKRDRAVRAHDRMAALRRERILKRGQMESPTDAQLAEAQGERDTALKELADVETDLGIQDAVGGTVDARNAT